MLGHKTLRRLVLILVILVVGWLLAIDGFHRRTNNTHFFFLKKDTGIPRGVGVCAAESGKKSWFVQDVEGSYGVKSHIPSVPILPCNTSGGEAF